MAVYFPLWKLNYSQNAISFLKFFKMIVLMEFLPTHLVTEPLAELFGILVKDEELADCIETDCEGSEDRILRMLLNEDESDAAKKSKELEDSIHDYHRKEKPNIIFAIGVILFLAIVLSAALILAMSIRCCIFSNYKCFSLYMNIKQKVFYNAFIRFAIQSAVKL